MAARIAKAWAAVSASPAAWVHEDLPLGRSPQCLDDPFYSVAVLHPVVAEDTLCFEAW